jgi:hypothetical protein
MYKRYDSNLSALIIVIALAIAGGTALYLLGQAGLALLPLFALLG